MKDVTYRVEKQTRVISSIALKDIADALKNKTILTGIITVLLLMVMYEWLPKLYNPGHTELVLYDAGNSSLVAELENDPRYRLRLAPSWEDFHQLMDDGDEGELGLVIPAGFDEALAAGDGPRLEGHVLWASRRGASELKLDYEQQLTALLGRPVQIDIAGTVYPEADAMGLVRNVALTLVLTVLFMGIFTLPHLMFEEKQSKTMEALLISPASTSQIVAGKALAGLFYCSVMALVVLSFNWVFVVDWGLAVVAISSVTLFAVGLGLVLGIFLDNKQQLTTWTLTVGQLLIVPLFLSAIDPILPEGLRAILPWMPMVAQALLLRYAFSGGVPLTQVLPPLAITLTSVLLVLALVAWRVARADR